MKRQKIGIFITVGLVFIFVIFLASTVAKRKNKAPVEIPQEMPAEKAQGPMIINGNVVGVGQEVDGYTVIKIDKDNVVLKKGPEEITLELYK